MNRDPEREGPLSPKERAHLLAQLQVRLRITARYHAQWSFVSVVIGCVSLAFAVVQASGFLYAVALGFVTFGVAMLLAATRRRRRGLTVLSLMTSDPSAIRRISRFANVNHRTMTVQHHTFMLFIGEREAAEVKLPPHDAERVWRLLQRHCPGAVHEST